LYAIFLSGGKQYRVEEGSKVLVEKLELEEGAEFKTDQILMVRTDTETLVGTPLVAGATVTGTVIKNGQGAKVTIFKKKKRKQYRRTQGHRQLFCEIQVQKISLR
jgi:large subunit ribosomal protein L21